MGRCRSCCPTIPTTRACGGRARSVSPLCLQVREPTQRRDAWHEEVFAALQYVERFDAVYPASRRLLRDGKHAATFFLQSHQWVAFVCEIQEVAVVDPFLLQELHRRHRPCTQKYEVESA